MQFLKVLLSALIWSFLAIASVAQEQTPEVPSELIYPQQDVHSKTQAS